MPYEVGCRVFSRDNFGRFMSELEAAATKTAEEGAVELAAYAKAYAPHKTGALRDSIHPVMISAREGAAVVGTGHWRHQEFGTAQHWIVGNPKLSFWWAKAGGRVVVSSVDHPGNPSVHFMKRAYESVKPRMMAVARRNYPG